jgi:hypothetical protein
MKIKTLLLGSAAAIVAAGGAQAADLSIAEPVEYVRVCDAFGVGYWYIPGTDTCIKIGGSVEFKIQTRHDGYTFGGENGWVITGVDDVSDDFGGVTTVLQGYSFSDVAHSSNWKFVTEAKVNFTAKSMTEYGALVGYVQLIGAYDPTNDAVRLDEAYLQLGHVLMGHTGSVQNTDEGFAPGAYRPDTSTNQIQLQWAAAGFGLYLGIEDPRERWGTELEPAFDGAYSMPDITGRITVSGGHWDARLTAGWGDLWDGGVYGIAGTITAGIDAIGTGSKVRVGASYGTGTLFVGKGTSIFTNYNTNWTAFISALWQATPTLGLAGTFAYARDETDDQTETAGGAKLIWTPVAGFEAYAEAKAWKTNSQTDHDWEATLGFKRSW